MKSNTNRKDSKGISNNGNGDNLLLEHSLVHDKNKGNDKIGKFNFKNKHPNRLIRLCLKIIIRNLMRELLLVIRHIPKRMRRMKMKLSVLQIQIFC